MGTHFSNTVTYVKTVICSWKKSIGQNGGSFHQATFDYRRQDFVLFLHLPDEGL